MQCQALCWTRQAQHTHPATRQQPRHNEREKMKDHKTKQNQNQATQRKEKRKYNKGGGGGELRSTAAAVVRTVAMALWLCRTV